MRSYYCISFSFQVWALALVGAFLVVSMVGCGPTHSARTKHELGLYVAPISNPGALNAWEFHAVDTQRVEKVHEKLGDAGFHEELKTVGSRRSALVSPGPILDSASYVTHWNDYMYYLALRQARKFPLKSERRMEAEKLYNESSSRIVFSFVLFMKDYRDFQKIPVILTNSQGLSARSIDITYEAVPVNVHWDSKDRRRQEYRFTGKVSFPILSDNGKPLIHPANEWIRVTVLPGSAIQWFEFRIFN